MKVIHFPKSELDFHSTVIMRKNCKLVLSTCRKLGTKGIWVPKNSRNNCYKVHQNIRCFVVFCFKIITKSVAGPYVNIYVARKLFSKTPLLHKKC